MFLYSYNLVHLLLEEFPLKSKLVTKFNFLHQNIHAHVNALRFTISNIKQLNSKSFYCILLLLSGDTSFNPGPTNNLQPLGSKKWNTGKSKGLHLVCLNISNYLSKIDEMWYIANSSNAAVRGISKSKLDESVLESEIQINNCDLLRRRRNRNCWGVACYITWSWSNKVLLKKFQKLRFLRKLNTIELNYPFLFSLYEVSFFYCSKPHISQGSIWISIFSLVKQGSIAI